MSEQPSTLEISNQRDPFNQKSVLLSGGPKLSLNKLLVANWDAQHPDPLLRWWSLTSPDSGQRVNVCRRRTSHPG